LEKRNEGKIFGDWLSIRSPIGVTVLLRSTASWQRRLRRGTRGDIRAVAAVFSDDQHDSLGGRILLDLSQTQRGSMCWRRVMRVEEVSQTGADRVGIGVVIGRYKFGQTESLAG